MAAEGKEMVQATFTLGEVGFKAKKIISIIWKDKNIRQ